MKKIVMAVLILILILSFNIMTFADTNDGLEVTEIVNTVSEDGQTGTIGYRIEFGTETELNNYLEKASISKLDAVSTLSVGVRSISKTYYYIPFDVRISVHWFENGANGYIMSMFGTYNLQDSGYTLKWVDSSTEPFLHSLDLKYTSIADTGYLGYMARYSTSSGNVILSIY